MNHPLPLILSSIVLLCPAAAHQNASSAVQRFEQAKLQRDALRLLQNIHRTLSDAESFFPPPQRELFLSGLREYLGTQKNYPLKQAQELAEKQNKYILRQLRKLDCFSPHAAQADVRVLPNGLQYDVYASAKAKENYKARRAHCLHTTIAGTPFPVYLNGMPTAIGEALYQAPRGLAWRFLLPVELLDEVDAAALRETGIAALEVLAMRESLPPQQLTAARNWFSAKKPSLPTITPETPEMHAERSRMAGIRLACSVEEPDSRLLPLVEELLPKLLTDNDPQGEELDELTAKAEQEYTAAREEMRKLKHRQIASEILHWQQRLPGTRILSNGILCRVTTGTPPSAPVTSAKFIEEEELGSEMYLRVQNRVIHAENDLPEPLMQVLNEVPLGTAWEIVIPPSLRKNQELPLRLRLRLSEKAKTPPPPLLPDTI